MRAGNRLSLLMAAALTLCACGVPADLGASPSTSTTNSVAEPEVTEMAIVSVTACRQSDPWRMVETAFEGVVTAISPEGAPHIEGGSDTLHWVTFQVSNWYTNDYGTSFTIWAPNFDGGIGEEWLIAGALYATLDQQSGEVFPCLATPDTHSARQEWERRLGSPVPAGSGSPETLGRPNPGCDAHLV